MTGSEKSKARKRKDRKRLGLTRGHGAAIAENRRRWAAQPDLPLWPRLHQSQGSEPTSLGGQNLLVSGVGSAVGHPATTS